jgi:hypothetical protein
MNNITLDFETADRITRLTLTEQRDYLASELDKLYATMDSENPYWMHPDDIDINHQMIKRINSILEYFGGELYGERKAGELKTSPSMVEALKGLEAYFLEIRKESAEQED